MQKTIRFDHNSRSVYQVGNGLMDNLSGIISSHFPTDHLLFLTDRNIYNLYGIKFINALRKIPVKVSVIILKNAERAKDFSGLNPILTRIFSSGVSRHSVLIAAGGGAVTDAAGFIASILVRGIKCVFIPTTLLSMVDAAIGGKNAFNLVVRDKLLKNMIGTFHQPSLVISDISLLKTLGEKEISNGFGEILKYHFAFSKPGFEDILSAYRIVSKADRSFSDSDSKILVKLIADCQNLKLDIVKKDPFDLLKIREVLNLGHTVGHAVESASRGKYSHGQAVSIGIATESLLSCNLGFLPVAALNLIIARISELNLEVKAPGLSPSVLIKLMAFDKKNGRFVLLKKIGETLIRDNVGIKDINKVLLKITQ